MHMYLAMYILVDIKAIPTTSTLNIVSTPTSINSIVTTITLVESNLLDTNSESQSANNSQSTVIIIIALSVTVGILAIATVTVIVTTLVICKIRNKKSDHSKGNE